jgi:hypothetical protein
MLEITQSAYSRIELGGNSPSIKYLLLMLENHGINPTWILTGIEPMILGNITIGNNIQQGNGNTIGVTKKNCPKCKELEEEVLKLRGQVSLLREMLGK